MTAHLSRFLARCASTVYPEPRSPGHDEITRVMAEAFNAKLAPGSTILDVGAGKGPALEWFTAAGHRPIGITLSTEDVRDCVAAGFDCREIDQNAMCSAWTGLFDAVWARHVCEHSPMPFFTLTEFWRVLKPGGWLYLELPSPGTVAKHETNQNHYSVLSPLMWSSLLERAGFLGFEAAHHINVPLAIGPDLYFAFTVQKPAEA